MAAIYSIRHENGEVLGGIDICYSPDDGGWYANEYDYSTAETRTRVSKAIYPLRSKLKRALDNGKHQWEPWT